MRNIVSVALLLAASCAADPSPGPDAAGASPPRLTPRPARVAGVAAPMLPLDGRWRFAAAAPAELGRAMGDAGAMRAWPEIEVPGEWAMQGFVVATGTPAAYWREFDVPADWAGRRVRLRFDAVHSLCSVWVNGVPVGTNESCFAPFEFDVTSALRPGRNAIALSVTSESTADFLASATQYAAHPLGGITRKVCLFALPAAHVAEQIVEADFDPVASNGVLLVRARVDGAGAGAGLRIALLDRDGTVAASARVPVDGGRASARMVLRSVRAWEPEHPNLYALSTELLDGEAASERIEQRVGFRRIEVRGHRLLVNGVPIKLRGANRHEVHPARGRSLVPELWRRDAELFRAANCNYVRTSHYPPAEEFLDACDELGLFVECEAALCWVKHSANPGWKERDPLDPALLPPFLRANLANVAANRNHPSVLLWSLANESLWTPLFEEVHRQVRAADPTRPVSFHDQAWGTPAHAASRTEVANHHYPDEAGPARCDGFDRPVLFGEYAHVQTYNRREIAADPGVRDDWGRGFARMWELVQAHDGCLGGAIWAGIDDVFCMPDGRYVGYGMWGAICDGWRRAKPETWHVFQTYAPIRIGVRSLPPPAAGVALRVPVANRHLFTDLSEVRIDWRCGGRTGTLRGSVPPGGTGELALPADLRPAPGDELRLTFTDPRGVVCQDAAVRIAGGEPAPRPVFLAGAAELVADVDTGRIRSVAAGGNQFMCGGPELAVLPLRGEECQPVDLGTWPPLNDPCSGWKAESVAVSDGTNGLRILRVRGACDGFSGAYTVSASPAGELAVDYRFAAGAKVDPRQWGMILRLPASFRRLAWERDGQWSLYPPDHIGRTRGEAIAAVAQTDRPYPNPRPDRPWKDDPTPLGGNDFSATRTGLRWLELTDDRGHGVRLEGSGDLAARVFVDGNGTGLFVCGFHTGGGDRFFNPHFAAERKPLKTGDILEGRFRLRLFAPGG